MSSTGCQNSKCIPHRSFDLTIITVCRNAGNELIPTIESVLWHKRHGRVSIEHLIIDGASTDSTLPIIEQYANDGAIEAYISEPDTGIYHAMNKGIHQAQGEVLYFLNAGDRLLETDLDTYVAPILQGDCIATAAPVITDNPERNGYFKVWLETCYLGAPVCHQGFFCAAKAYKTLGGYDLTYRCIADAKFMCSCISKYGPPTQIQTPVAFFPENGFSQNCSYTFLNEFIQLRSEFLQQIVEKARSSSEYRYFAIGVIGESAFTLLRWMKDYGTDKKQLIQLLQEQCRKIRHITSDPIRRIALLWIERKLLTHVFRGEAIYTTMAKIMRYAEAAILPPPTSFYVTNQLIRPTYLRSLLLGWLAYIFNRRVASPRN